MFSAGTFDHDYFTKYPQGFCSLVKQASGGRLIIKPFSSGEVVPVIESLEAVGKGVIEGSVTASAYWAGKIPVAAFSWGPPFSIYGNEAVNTYLWDYEGGIVELVREAYKPFNVYLLSVHSNGDSPLMSKKPVYSLADYKGLKVRCIGLAGDVLTKAGASITYLPSPEIYMGLETGVIDAANFGGVGPEVALGFDEVTDYVLFPGVTGMVTSDIMVNLDAFNALPDDLKAIVAQAAQAHSEPYGRWLILQNDLTLKELVEEGRIEVCWMPPDEVAKVKEIAMGVMEEFAMKDPLATEAFKRLKGYLELLEIRGE